MKYPIPIILALLTLLACSDAVDSTPWTFDDDDTNTETPNLTGCLNIGGHDRIGLGSQEQDRCISMGLVQPGVNRHSDLELPENWGTELIIAANATCPISFSENQPSEALSVSGEISFRDAEEGMAIFVLDVDVSLEFSDESGGTFQVRWYTQGLEISDTCH